MTKTILLILLILMFDTTFGQQNSVKNTFDYVVRNAFGDLNNDGLEDKAIIAMDTIDNSRPFKLEIFLSNPNGEYHSFFSSTTIIEAMYPPEKNGAYNGSQIPDVNIEDDKLQLDFYIKGNSRYEFQIRKEQFRLIHFTFVHYDSKNITEIAFDLLKNQYSKQVEILETSKITEKIDKEVRIRPLPTLKGFKPFINEYY
ncbi:hypothetical protein [Aquimarina algicola]|uniref:VCBS repeat-containing protein n=1 Tax=Aquimarina algicola TaxID=2589995 RepID=A0A504J4G2_9FLAO|nr:hypothetical protein [Aquimarina algicola]TPN83382.1 hypothetical protein FHK87_19365 [Aquimarina algicola]